MFTPVHLSTLKTARGANQVEASNKEVDMYILNIEKINEWTMKRMEVDVCGEQWFECGVQFYCHWRKRPSVELFDPRE